jgi:polyhydroxyalkanoate synthesis regulator phasin
MRDTVAEMAAKAHEISLEAGSKMAAAMKDVVGAAAGLTAFAIESARDLVQYMVRRGQMTQEEADKLIREAEEANAKRPKSNLPPPKSAEASKKASGSTPPAAAA